MRKHFQICNRRSEHWRMFSLQSDFLRHSLTKLLGAAELRPFICSCTSVVLCYAQTTQINHTVLKQSSRPTSSDSLQVWLGKAESSDVAQSIPHCSYAIRDLEMLTFNERMLTFSEVVFIIKGQRGEGIIR